MAPRNLLNWGLLATALGLALIVWMEPGQDLPTAPTQLSTLDPERIEGLRIERSGRPTIELTRRPDHRWELEGTPPLPANDFRIRTLLGILRSPSQAQYAVGEINQAELGLNPPRAVLAFDDTRLEIGDTSPINQYRYVKLGDRVHLVADTWYPFLTGEPSDFVRLRPLADDQRIRSLSLPGLALSMDAQGAWQHSLDRPLNSDQLQGFIQRWHGAQALQVKPHHPGPSLGEIRIGLKGHDQGIDLYIQAREPELILARPDWGIDYYFSAQQGQALLQPPAEPDPPPGSADE